MRYRVKDYTVSPSGSSVWLYFTAPQGVELSSDPDNEIEPFIAQAIRLVVDENAGIVFCSSMQKQAYLEKAKCTPATHQIRLCFGVPSGKFVSETNAFTIEMDWGDAPGASPSADALASFFNITEATEYTALTPAEAIAIARDCQYNVMGTDWPIPTWLPTGVTEAQVESAAEGLGIPYHEPTQTA